MFYVNHPPPEPSFVLSDPCPHSTNGLLVTIEEVLWPTGETGTVVHEFETRRILAPDGMCALQYPLPDISPGLQVCFVSLWSRQLIPLIGRSASCSHHLPCSWVGFLVGKPTPVAKTAPIGVAVRGADQKVLHWGAVQRFCPWCYPMVLFIYIQEDTAD